MVSTAPKLSIGESCTTLGSRSNTAPSRESVARNGSKPDALREGGTELGMERDIASLLILLPLIAFAVASLAELTLIVSLSRTPVSVIHWPANWPIC